MREWWRTNDAPVGEEAGAANAADSLETEVVLDLQSLFAHDEVLLPLHQSCIAAAHLSNEGDFRVLLSSGFP